MSLGAGLGPERNLLVDFSFTGIPPKIGDVGFVEIAMEPIIRHKASFETVVLVGEALVADRCVREIQQAANCGAILGREKNLLPVVAHFQGPRTSVCRSELNREIVRLGCN